MANRQQWVYQFQLIYVSARQEGKKKEPICKINPLLFFFCFLLLCIHVNACIYSREVRRRPFSRKCPSVKGIIYHLSCTTNREKRGTKLRISWCKASANIQNSRESSLRAANILDRLARYSAKSHQVTHTKHNKMVATGEINQWNWEDLRRDTESEFLSPIMNRQFSTEGSTVVIKPKPPKSQLSALWSCCW